MASFAEATAIKAVDPRTYTAYFHDGWAIGNVPHGGVVTSTVLAAVKLHFETTLSSYNQPHTINLHLEFLRRTSVGPATITVQNVKLGRQTSTVHVILTQSPSQGDNDSATPTTCVVGYLTQSNLFAETGVSLSTRWTLHPPPPPLSSTAKMRRGDDPNWALQKDIPFPKFRKASQHVNIFLPREKQTAEAKVDEWLCFSKPGEKFTQESLGFVADTFPQIVENCFPAAEVRASLSDNAEHTESSSQETLAQQKKQVATFWYPTLLLNLDIKKTLPSDGAEFLFVRIRSKTIKKGRMDIELVILDEDGDLVASSTHVALILGSERNLKRSGQNGESKI
ncbi:MAG: hypothetical protein Q9195_001792 [Heterodermia aff. obscurata]